MKKKFGVLGGGSWGTAIVKILSENCNSINWYVRNQTNVEYIEEFKCNPNYLSSISLNLEKINISSSIQNVTKNSEIIILAIPSPFLNSELKKIKNLIKEKYIFSACCVLITMLCFRRPFPRCSDHWYGSIGCSRI